PKYSEVVVNIMRCLRATVLLSIGFLVMRADAATRPHLLFSSESAFYNDLRQSQSQAGGLRVTVTDAQQHLLSGINCSLLLSSDLSTIVAKSATDRDGVATFHEVIVGEYILTVEGPGFETLRKSGVVIHDSKVDEIKIVLAVASVSASVTINSEEEETAAVKNGATIPSGNLARETIQRLPFATARVDEALPLIPGVVRSPTGEISMKGASEQQSMLLINGLNASDPASGNFRLNLPSDSVEAVQVFLHPYTAENGQ